MLEGLNDIDWSSLTHAYGSAADVPDLLHALTSDDASTRKDAISAFYGNIYHQGTVYEASAYAAPFLISLLNEPTVADKWEILSLLASLAEGASYHDVHGFWQPTEHDASILDRELDWVKRTRQAVAEGSATYLSLLDHEDAMVRHVAPFTLARSVVRSSDAADQMMEQAKEDSDELVRASLMLAIGSLAEPLERACTEFLARELATATVPIVRLAAALALRRVGGEEMFEHVFPVIAETAGPAMERGQELIWIQMGKEFFSEIENWLGGTPESRFCFFERVIETTAGGVRASAIYSLMDLCNTCPEIAPLSAPLMTRLVSDEDAEVRKTALRLLDDVPASRSGALATLLGLVGRARDEKESQQIAKVICHYRDPSLVPVLASFIRQNLGTDAIKALGALGPAAASEAPLLVHVLHSPGSGSSSAVSNTRIAAALALGEMGEAAAKIAIPALIRALNEGHAKRAVPQALGKFGPLARAAEPALLHTSEHGDACEQGFAILALWQINVWPARIAAERLTTILESSEKIDRRLIAGLLASSSGSV